MIERFEKDTTQILGILEQDDNYFFQWKSQLRADNAFKKMSKIGKRCSFEYCLFDQFGNYYPVKK